MDDFGALRRRFADVGALSVVPIKISVGSHDDLIRLVAPDDSRKFADGSGSRDFADAGAIGFAEPHCSVRSGGQRAGASAARDAAVFAHDAGHRDARDFIRIEFREPQISVGTRGKSARVRARRNSRGIFRDARRRRESRAGQAACDRPRRRNGNRRLAHPASVIIRRDRRLICRGQSRRAVQRQCPRAAARGRRRREHESQGVAGGIREVRRSRDEIVVFIVDLDRQRRRGSRTAIGACACELQRDMIDRRVRREIVRVENIRLNDDRRREIRKLIAAAVDESKGQRIRSGICSEADNATARRARRRTERRGRSAYGRDGNSDLRVA